MYVVPEKPVTEKFSWRQSVKRYGYVPVNPARRQPEMSLRSFYMHQDKKRTKGSSLMRGLGAALLMMLPALVFADEPAPVPNKGDTAWMIVATLLVIMMAVPGLALFYGGMVRAKNMLSISMQVFVIFALCTVLWVVYGYSLAFNG